MNMLVLGANSEIAVSIIEVFAQKGGIATLHMASRDVDALERKKSDFELRSLNIENIRIEKFDALLPETHRPFYDSLSPRPDIVIVAFGYLGYQEKAQQDFDEARKILDVNFTGAMSVCEIVARDFEVRGDGVLMGISSVAGLRGRKKNYIYGAAKAAFTTYLSGLRNRLAKKGIRVITVLPGFVDTKMTAHMELPNALTASPFEVAEDVWRAYKKGNDIVYSRWVWRWIMCAICHIPERIFKKMDL